MKASGHHVVVTGGSRGIGLALARKFLDQGSEVLIIARDAARLERRVGEEPRFKTLAADLALDDEIERVADHIGRDFAALNVLVNNAGIQTQGVLADGVSAGAARRELAVNVMAPVLLSAALLPLIRKNGGGAVVNVSSVLAIEPKRSAPVYSASKAFMRSFSLTLGYQLEDAGVRVFDIAPPMVDTDMTAGRGGGKISPRALADEFWSYWLKDKTEVPIGKTKLVKALHRVSPALVRRMMRRR